MSDVLSYTWDRVEDKAKGGFGLRKRQVSGDGV